MHETRSKLRAHALGLAVVALPLAVGAVAAGSTSVDFDAVSHSGLRDLGPASTGLKLQLELGMVADQQGIATRVES